jgi:cardiolipin synthase
VPVFISLFFRGHAEGSYLYAFIIYFIAALTDFFDGYLARRNNWVSELGKLLDPLADKMTQSAVLICMAAVGLLHWVIVGLFLAKELFMMVGAILVRQRIKVTVKSNWYGKGATVLFHAVILVKAIFIRHISPWLGNLIFSIMLLVMLIVMVLYIRDTLRINKSKNDNV